MKMLKITLLLGLFIVASGESVRGQGFIAVLPSGSAFDGNSSTLQPFSVPSSRLQQVYRAGPLTDLDPNEVVRLDRLMFRVDVTNGVNFFGSLDLHVRLSTTSQAVDSLSPVFSMNTGPNETTGYSGSVLWSGFQRAVPVFDLSIDFQQPFFYRPADGNLLLDITVGNSLIYSQLDAWDRTGDSVSSVFGPSGAASGTPSTLGLVTLFQFVHAVPEPGLISIVLLGTAIVFYASWKRTSLR